MKYLSGLFFVVLFCVSTANGATQGKHLFIMSGQSNMARLDLELSFIPAVEKKYGKDNVIVVKHAKGGRSISWWYKKWKHVGRKKTDPKTIGFLYDELMAKVKEATKGQKIKTITFGWMQGEQDASQNVPSEVYLEALKGVFAQLKADLKRKEIYFVIGRINDAFLKSKGWQGIRQVHEEFAKASKWGAWVNTDDLNDGKNRAGQPTTRDLHCMPEGFVILGQRFADKAIALIGK